jgi:2'-5' RNA ligase
MGRVRTFVAIDPGDDIQSHLLLAQRKLARDVSDVKWVEEANLHLTLLFLGEVRDRDLSEICRCVTRSVAATNAFVMEFKGIGCFPNTRRPRVVWVGVAAGAAETIALHDAIETPLLELGCYRREERQFTPHLTLGRTKSDLPGEQLARVLPQYQDWRAGEAVVREVLVMSSELTSHGPEYTVLGRAKLKG